MSPFEMAVEAAIRPALLKSTLPGDQDEKGALAAWVALPIAAAIEAAVNHYVSKYDKSDEGTAAGARADALEALRQTI